MAIFAFLPVLSPFSVHAGVFSILGQFLGVGQTITTTERAVNSQVMALLQGAVNVDPNPAKGGGGITIVDGSALLSEDGPSGTLADVSESASEGAISLYVVRKGDTLNGVAVLFGVTPNTIVWANSLTTRTLKEGQMLTILPISGVKHVVVKGDTPSSIAKKYKADAEEIAHYNDLLSGSPLAVGTEIIVPDGEIAIPKASTGASPYRGGSGPVYQGYYLRPVLGGVKTQGLHGYNGIDIASYYGAPILASAAGSVIVSKNSGWNGGYGNYVVITHANGTQTLYSHLQSSIVEIGESIVQGQVIGYMGASGKATGTHLHFEVRGAANPF